MDFQTIPPLARPYFPKEAKSKTPNAKKNLELEALVEQVMCRGHTLLPQTLSRHICARVKNAPSITVALNIINQELSKDHEVSSWICNELLDCQGSWESKKLIFKKMPDNCCVSSLFIKYMKLANENDDYQEIKDAYRFAIQYDQDNIQIHNIFIRSALKHNDLDLATDTFENLIDTGVVDTQLFNTFLKQAQESKRELNKKKLLEFINRIKDKNINTYDIFINYIGSEGYLTEALQAFNEAESQGKLDPLLCNSMMNVASENGNYELVREIFNKAVKSGNYNQDTFSLFIRCADKFKKYADAEKAFQQAESLALKDPDITNRFIFAAANNGHFDAAFMAYKTKIRAFPQATSVYNTMINVAGKMKKLNISHLVLDKAIKNNAADSGTYSALIYVAALNGRMELAKETYQLAKENKKLSSYLFTTVITQFGCHDFEQSNEAFQQALSSELVDTKLLNAYLISAGDNQDYDLAKAAFEKSLKHADISSYTCLFEAAVKTDHFAEACQIFNQLKKNGKLDCKLLTRVIVAAGKAEEFSLADEAYQIARQKKIIDTFLANEYILAAANCRQLKQAKEAFDFLTHKKTLNPYSYHHMMLAYESHQNYEDIDALFKQMIDNEIDNEVTYITYLQCIGKKDFSKAKAAFDLAVSRGCIDSKTFSSYISIAGCHNEFEEATNAFNKAKDLKFDKIAVYNAYIHAARCDRRYDVADKVFEYTKIMKIDDAWTQRTAVKTFSDANRLEDAKELYLQALNDKERKINAKFFTDVIQAFGKHKFYKDAEEAFDQAKARGMVDSFTYAAFIYVAGKCLKFDMAFKAFKEALELSGPTVQIYTNFLYAADLCNKFQIAEEVFSDAVNKKCTDCYVYCIWLNIASRFKKFDDLKQIYQEAKKHSCVDSGLIAKWIKICNKKESYLDARSAYEDAVKREINETNVTNAFLKTSSQIGSAEDTETFFTELKKTSKAIDSTYIIWIQFLGQHKSFEECRKFFHTYKRKIKDPSFYSQYIKIAGKFGHYQEAKDCFDEAKKRGKANSLTYAYFVSALGMCQMLHDPKEIGNPHQIHLQPRELVLSTIEKAREVFYESKQRGLINPEFYQQFVNILCKVGYIEEAESVFHEAEALDLASDIARNLLFMWKYQSKHQRSINLPPLSALSISDQRFVNSLYSGSYQLFLRIAQFKKLQRTSQVETKHDFKQFISKKLHEKLEEPITIIPREGSLNPFSTTLKNILIGFHDTIKKQNISLDYMRLEGGAVHACLEKEQYQQALQKLDLPDCPFLDEETSFIFEQIYNKLPNQKPADWDFKILLESKTHKAVVEVSDHLVSEIGSQTKTSSEVVKDGYFFKQSLTMNEGSHYSLRRVMDANGCSYEFAIGRFFSRPFLFNSDAVKILLQAYLYKKTQRKGQTSLLSVSCSLEDALIDYLLKRLNTDSIKGINEFGFFSAYFSRLSLGYLSSHETMESSLCQIYGSLPAKRKMELLLHGLNNHCGNNHAHGLSLLFNACSALYKTGYIMEAEELRAISDSFLGLKLTHPFLESLKQIWVDEKVPYLFVRAVLQMTGLLSFLSKETSQHPFICKLDEHSLGQVMHFNIEGAYFIVPYDPEDTLNVLSSSLDTQFLPSMKKYFSAIGGSCPITFHHHISPKLMKFLGFKTEQIETIDQRWKELRNQLDILLKSVNEFKEDPEISLKPEQVQPQPQTRGYFSGIFQWMWSKTE